MLGSNSDKIFCYEVLVSIGNHMISSLIWNK